MGIEAGNLVFVLGLLIGMIILAELGSRQVRKEQARGDSRPEGGVVESSLFALLGLMLAFAFTGASSRLDERRNLVISEANAIGTAALRLDLLKEPTLARAALKDYIQTRIDYSTALARGAEEGDAWIAAQAAQSDLWNTILLSIDPANKQSEQLLILPSVNEAFDLAARRHVMRQVHLPWPVQGMLALLALLCSWIAGRLLYQPVWSMRLVRWSLAFVVCLTLMLIKDLDYPRLGFITVSGSDKLLKEVQESLAEGQDELSLTP